MTLLVTDRLAEGRVTGRGRRGSSCHAADPRRTGSCCRRTTTGWRVAEVYDA